MTRKSKIATPQVDPAFAALASDMFSELNDLLPEAPITVEPYHRPDMIEVLGTLWDGRPFQETYRQENSDVFVLKSVGCRYRVVAGDFYNGNRKRRYAAFLVQ